jgi:hypothetical protein
VGRSSHRGDEDQQAAAQQGAALFPSSSSAAAGGGRQQLVALGVASSGFFFVFGAWGLMENLISTYYKRLGYYSMALVYFGIGPGALIAPAIIAK